MSSIKEFLQSFFEASRERLRNPAIGTFIFSWIAINWRFVAILFFSDSSLEERINLIEQCYLRIDLNLWYPLIVMGVYMLILPNLMALFDALSQKAISYRKDLKNKNRLNDIIARNKHRLEDVISQQEIAAEERQLELIEEGSPDINKLKKQLEEVRAENELLKKNNGNLTERSIEQKKEETKIAADSSEKKAGQSTKKSPTKKTSKAPENPKEEEFEPLPTSKDFPAMRDNVIRNIAKSEKEWILLYGFYAGNFGKKEFTRDQILSAYKETKRKTKSRHMNLSNNINALVKQGFIRFLNDEEMLLTDSGFELVEEILNR